MNNESSELLSTVQDEELLSEKIGWKLQLQILQVVENGSFVTHCWRALARQLPILYNSEKKAKSVGCKIEHMRSRLFFYVRAFRGACE